MPVLLILFIQQRMQIILN